MAQRKTLTERQIEVLQWVAEGAPAVDEEEAQSRRISAAALRGRGFVTTSGRGPLWTATITPAGTEYLQKASATNAPTPRRPNELVTERLVADVIAAGGSLVIEDAPRGYGADVNWEHRVKLAQRHNKVPAGKHLVTNWINQRRDLQIDLIDAPDGHVVDVTPVPVSDHVSRYHPFVTEFREQKEHLEVSRALLPRALRIFHGIVLEAERRGYAVGVVGNRSGTERREPAWSGDKHGHFTITIDDFTACLRFREEGISRRWTPPSGWQLREWEQRPWTKPKAHLHEEGATGKLAISVVAPYFGEGRTSQWADRKTWTLEEKLGELFAELELRAVEDRHRREIEAREEEKRQRRWAEELERARQRYLEHTRREELARQLDSWRVAERVRSYCAAVEAHHADDEQAMAWVTWARGYAQQLDPIAGDVRGPSLPSDLPDYKLKDFIKDWSSSPSGHRSLW
ncbi:MAG: hypothetical protein QOF60_2821 [Actinomycetota bacterium]|jgi:hypothetical protein|nr:hypothetical protein [Actinomycetota bacterium]